MPTDNGGKNKDQRTKTTPFTTKEVDRLRRIIPTLRTGKRDEKYNLRDIALFNTAISTMLRIGDVLSLKVEDVMRDGDILDESTIVMQKTKKQLVVELRGTGVKESLKKWIEFEGKTSKDLIFTGRQGSGHLTSAYMRGLIKRWCDAAGIDSANKSTHSLRKTRATFIYDGSKNIEAVRQLLGHQSLEVTKAYLGVDKKKVMELSNQYRM